MIDRARLYEWALDQLASKDAMANIYIEENSRLRKQVERLDKTVRELEQELVKAAKESAGLTLLGEEEVDA